jgi:hypothetical protein
MSSVICSCFPNWRWALVAFLLANVDIILYMFHRCHRSPSLILIKYSLVQRHATHLQGRPQMKTINVLFTLKMWVDNCQGNLFHGFPHKCNQVTLEKLLEDIIWKSSIVIWIQIKHQLKEIHDYNSFQIHHDGEIASLEDNKYNACLWQSLYTLGICMQHMYI